MVGRDLDENDPDPVRILDPHLDQPPGLGNRRPENADPGRGQTLMLGVNVAHLKPDLHRGARRTAGAPGHLKQPGAEEEHHPRISRRAELPVDRQPQHVAVEPATSAEVGGPQQDPAAQDVHVPNRDSRLPATGRALARGAIDLDRARLIAETTSVLSEEQARAVEKKILPAAGGLVRTGLRERLTRAVINADPDGAEKRREHAERQADVRLHPDDDHTATIVGSKLPQIHAAAALARLTALARACKAAGMTGSLGFHRAQVMIGLILGTLPPIPPATDAPPDQPPPGDDPGPRPDDEGPSPDDDGAADGNRGTPDAVGGPEPGNASAPADDGSAHADTDSDHTPARGMTYLPRATRTRRRTTASTTTRARRTGRGVRPRRPAAPPSLPSTGRRRGCASSSSPGT